jgi:hypothetical protein
VCELGASAAVPVLNVSGYACPAGHFCLAGAVTPAACPPGAYAPSEGASSCLPCPARSDCPGATAVPLDCPANHYCGASTGAPAPCPDGSWGGPDQVTGFALASECASCIAGSYCAGGVIAGPCAAGFICVFGQGVANPPSQQWQATGGGLCPVGFYCPQNSSAPTACPANTYTQQLGSTTASDCAACPPGYTCSSASPAPVACAAGGYCLSNTGSFLACPAFCEPARDCFAALAAAVASAAARHERPHVPSHELTQPYIAAPPTHLPTRAQPTTRA